ncbi:MAG: CPBP family intramembrane metalloprotease [Deltaproteobacteria bacterium]|nr:CPBP family intramembrane metalloprotease [Deltaproteobacteria bacterium]MDQ3297456.1 CPBP family glutamic-type intramembrane protease [Myxococcota bacterium]
MKRGATWAGHGDLPASLVLIFPLLLAYEIGVLFAGRVNGADVITRAVYSSLGRTTYLLVYAVIALGFLIWIRQGRRWASLTIDVVAPVFLEAALYALTLGALITLILDRVLGLGITGGEMVNALGAGVHEELVFRLGLLGGLVALGQRALSSRLAIAVAIVASSVAFSAAHHIGIYGEAWSTHAFAFRCLAGVAFALIFWFRSLAHVVYAHVFYDLLVYWRM